jgi:hypothetical protein
MISFEEAGRILDEEAAALPEEVFRELNGGVNLLPDRRIDPEGLVTLGMYFHNPMGRYVEIYYGSFAEAFGRESDDAIREEMKKTLRHELTHHLEGLAGDRSLERWDEANRAEIMAQMNGSPKNSPLFAGGYTGPGIDSPMRRRRHRASGDGRDHRGTG